MALSLILRPESAGDDTNVENVSGATYHWEAVSDQSDSSWVNTGITVDNWRRDLYNIPIMTPTGSISSVTLTAKCKYGAGISPTTGYKAAIKVGGTVYNGTNTTLTTTFTEYTYSWATNPNTSAVWKRDDITNLQIGIELRRSLPASASYCSEVYITIAFNEPIPCEIIENLLDGNWSTYNSTLTEPSWFVINDGINPINIDLTKGDYVVIRPYVPSHTETLRDSWKYMDTVDLIELEINSKTSRQQLYNLMAGIRRVIHSNIHDLTDFQVVRFRDFTEIFNEQFNVWKGRLIIALENNRVYIDTL